MNTNVVRKTMMNNYDDGGGEDDDEKDADIHLVCGCELFWTGGCGELGNDTAGLYLVTMMMMTSNNNNNNDDNDDDE